MTMDVEAKARELLAASMKAEGCSNSSIRDIVSGAWDKPAFPRMRAVMRTIEALLQPPEPQSVAPEIVERVARAIDSSSWAMRDADALRREYYDKELKRPWGGIPFEDWRDRSVQRSLGQARAAIAALPSPVEGGELAEFEIWHDGAFGDDDAMVAGTSGPREKALAEARHYAAVYGQDGPVRIFEVFRIPVEPPSTERGKGL